MTAVQPTVNAPRTAISDARANRTPRLLVILTLAAVIGLAISLYFGLVYAGQDFTQGDVQRIMYIHVASFFGAFVAFGATVVGGIAYLRTRAIKWDALALAGVEVGFALSVINLLTGSIWARPIWNTWWTWDPRLTSAAIMVLTYAAYLMLRQGIENPDTRRRFASVYGIFAFSTVVITLVITRIRPDTIHPVVIGPSPQNAEGTPSMTDSMTTAMRVGIVVWTLLIPTALMWWRVRLENAHERVNALRARLLEQER